MGISSFALVNRNNRVEGMPYADTDELIPGFDAKGNPISTASSDVPSTPSVTADRKTATTRATGGTAAPDSKEDGPVSPRKGRRGSTLASLDSSVNKPSILGG